MHIHGFWASSVEDSSLAMLQIQSWGCFRKNKSTFINVIPDYLTGYVGGNTGDFPVLAIDLCPKGGALTHFQSQGDSKKHTNIY